MRALLTDLDRTLTGPDLTLDPRVPPRLAQLREAGVRVVIVTGRPLDHVLALELDEVSDAVVAENGCVVAFPGDGHHDVEAADFGERARAALGPLAARFHWGRVLGSGPREIAQECAARLMAADVRHALSYNAEEVMLLPEGVDKAAGALRALRRLGVPARDAAALGDGENDVPMLALVGLGAAPANAHLAARQAAKVSLKGAYADGFLELSERLLAGAPQEMA